MTLLMTGRPDERGEIPTESPTRSWVEIATRAHAILTGSLPDETLDELLAARPAHEVPFRLPTFLVG